MSTLKTKISKILVAVDGSESSMDAADYAILLAKQNNAQLIALHVARPGDAYQNTSTTNSVGVGTSPTASTGSVIEAVKQEFQKWFHTIDQKAGVNNVQVKTDIVIYPNTTAATIVDYAEREGIDLIVMGTRGKSGFKRLLLGSTASGVTTYAHCAVLIVK